MDRILIFIKKFIPQKIFVFFQPMYHFMLSFLSAWRYGFPGNKLMVIGVTGTTGKTTSVYLMAKMLQDAGIKVGWTSTALLSDGKREWLNDKKMTMLGRFFTQKMLRDMVRNNCEVAIIETTSEGIRQFRHRFINYDIVIFTGIYPEHIESHGSFENYKNEKLKLFKHLEKLKYRKSKFKNDKIGSVQKTIIVNGDDEYVDEFLNFEIFNKIVFSKNDNFKVLDKWRVLRYKPLETNDKGVKFLFENKIVQLKLLGDFNVMNAVIAGCVGYVLRLDDDKIKSGLESVKNIPGRLEKIDEGQNFTVIVDYAFEPRALGKLYDTVLRIKHNKIIHVLGSAGGGRDISRRQPLGQIAGKNADIVIVTNEDPYDDDPMEIIKNVADGAKKSGKILNKNLFLIKDRRSAIKKAINMAKMRDMILITGKGCEQAICLRYGKKQEWDDRKIVREFLSLR